jgi:hypothetical protein
MKAGKKGQAAMEYLMTYGWAILIILIALGALFYLGVFRPKASNVCMGSPPLQCTDVKLTQDGVLTLVLGAVGTDEATLTSASLTSPEALNSGALTIALDENPSSKTVTMWTGNRNQGKKFAGSATATTTMEGSTVQHTKIIQFSGSIE